MIITHVKVLIKTFDSKQKTQKALKGENLVSSKDRQKRRPQLKLLNKITTTLEYCVKYDFVAPLNDEEHGNNPKMKNLKPLTELFPYYYKQLKKNLF